MNVRLDRSPSKIAWGSLAYARTKLKHVLKAQWGQWVACELLIPTSKCGNVVAAADNMSGGMSAASN